MKNVVHKLQIELIHFIHDLIKRENISPTCLLFGELDFTPEDKFSLFFFT